MDVANAPATTYSFRHRYLPCDASWHPLDDDVQCLDLDETVKITVGDREVRQHLLDRFGISDPIKVQTLDKEKRNETIISCLELGTGLRQPTHEARADESLLSVCLARRRKTKG